MGFPLCHVSIYAAVHTSSNPHLMSNLHRTLYSTCCFWARNRIQRKRKASICNMIPGTEQTHHIMGMLGLKRDEHRMMNCLRCSLLGEFLKSRAQAFRNPVLFSAWYTPNLSFTTLSTFCVNAMTMPRRCTRSSPAPHPTVWLASSGSSPRATRVVRIKPTQQVICDWLRVELQP